jgi:hypothetical protein
MAQRQTEQTDDPASCEDREPYILFLGAGCGRAAGVPSVEEIMQKELAREYGPSADAPPRYDADDPAGSLKKFYKWLETLSPGEVFRMFQAHYVNTPVPLFYQDLALLIKNRFFNRILTTNCDTLLEQALGGAGLALDVDFEVTSFGVSTQGRASRRRPTHYGASESAVEPVRIFKLHGDLAEGQLMLAPWQIEEALKSRPNLTKQELKGDLVMVGYQFESPLLNDWLSLYQKREVWWVSADLHPLQTVVPAWGEDIAYVVGEAGKPEEFFSQLTLRLLRLPALQRQRQESADFPTEEQSAAIRTRGLDETPPPEDEELLLEDLRGQIRRFQVSLSSLEQKAIPDERPASLQNQIDYQKRQIVVLEDKLRSLTTSGSRLLWLLQTVSDNLEEALSDPEVEHHVSGTTVSFLKNQCQAVQEQYATAEPNQQIISAAVGAAAILAERLYVELGAKVVRPETVRDLASFVPTVATRGIK